MPRRLCTQSHVDYVREAAAVVQQKASELRDYRIESAPPVLRHFTASFQPLGKPVRKVPFGACALDHA